MLKSPGKAGEEVAGQGQPQLIYLQLEDLGENKKVFVFFKPSLYHKKDCWLTKEKD